jgi:DNA-binding response OmpR family regulator
MSPSISPPDKSAFRYSVLLVDHEASVRDVLQVCLDDLGGWDVQGALSLWQGIEMLAGIPPDIILLDAPYIEVCAKDLVDQLREQPWLRSVPVVFITAKASWFSKQQLQSWGVAGALPKPFNPLTLPDQIRSLLAGYIPRRVQNR